MTFYVPLQHTWMEMPHANSYVATIWWCRIAIFATKIYCFNPSIMLDIHYSIQSISVGYFSFVFCFFSLCRQSKKGHTLFFVLLAAIRTAVYYATLHHCFVIGDNKCLTIWIDFDDTVNFVCVLLVFILVLSESHSRRAIFSVLDFYHEKSLQGCIWKSRWLWGRS